MLKGWECQGCKAYYKLTKSYYDANPSCPDRCSECGETVFKRVEEMTEFSGLYDKKNKVMGEYEDSEDQMLSLSETLDAIRRR